MIGSLGQQFEAFGPRAWARGVWRGPAWVPAYLKLEWRLELVRWMGIVGVALTLPFIPMEPSARALSFGLLGLASAYSVILLKIMRRRPGVLASGYLATVADGLLTIAMLYLTGGSQASPLYMITVTLSVATAMRYGYRPSVLLALLFCTFDALDERALGGNFLSSGILFRSCFLLMTVLMASYVQEQARMANTELTTSSYWLRMTGRGSTLTRKAASACTVSASGSPPSAAA